MKSDFIFNLTNAFNHLIMYMHVFILSLIFSFWCWCRDWYTQFYSILCLQYNFYIHWMEIKRRKRKGKKQQLWKNEQHKKSLRQRYLILFYFNFLLNEKQKNFMDIKISHQNHSTNIIIVSIRAIFCWC